MHFNSPDFLFQQNIIKIKNTIECYFYFRAFGRVNDHCKLKIHYFKIHVLYKFK